MPDLDSERSLMMALGEVARSVRVMFDEGRGRCSSYVCKMGVYEL